MTGDTYEPDIDLSTIDIEKVKLTPVSDQSDLVFFDLETTGLGKCNFQLLLYLSVMCLSVRPPYVHPSFVPIFFNFCTFAERTADIIQIAGICGDQRFNKYVMPMKPITPGAMQATGLSVRYNKLYCGNTEVSTVSLLEALVSFLDFLSTKKSPVLVGHNIMSYDTRVLLNALKKVKMVSAYCDVVTGCIDTLIVAKKKLDKSEVSSFRQQYLVEKYLPGRLYRAHDALADVEALQDLYHAVLELSPRDFGQYSFSLLIGEHYASLHPLVQEKLLTKAMQSKLSKCGLGLPALKKLHSRDSENGVRAVICQRVTKRLSVANKIVQYLDAA